MGNVIGAHGRVLKPWDNCRGYYTVWICNTNGKKKTTVHKIVATAFLPNTENKPTVNHKNHDRKDNRLENLEWATYSEQTIHSPVPLSASGQRNINIITQGSCVRYRVMVRRNNVRLYCKKFLTLEEAIAARDVFFTANNISPVE